MNPQPNPLLLDAIHQWVEIHPYDPGWPGQFSLERTRLLQRFPDVFQSIEHFGSTAVPGLAAKPVIDMLAGVGSLCVADELLGPLCQAGYDTSMEFNATLKDRRWLSRRPIGPTLATMSGCQSRLARCYSHERIRSRRN